MSSASIAVQYLPSVALNGEQVAKESATGRLIAHETNAIEQLDHLLSY